MAQQNLLLKSAGLYSYPNRLSSIPTGALLRAKNIVINRDNIAESRRGFKIYGNTMGSTDTNTAHQLLTYKGRVIRHWGDGAGTTLDSDSNGTGTFTSFGFSLTGDTHANTTIDNIVSTSTLTVGMFVSATNLPNGTTIVSIDSNNAITVSNAATTSVSVTLSFTYNIQEAVTGLRIKGVEQNGNLFITTSNGIQKISANSSSSLVSSPITLAGSPKALDFTAAINTNLGFLSPQSVVAYRIVWGIKDLNNNLILGAPSQRVILQNPDSVNSATADLRITIPRTITTSHFYQAYRTQVFENLNTFSFTGDTTNTSTTISNIADTSALSFGMTITGTGISANTTIVSISSSTSIVISNAATATNSGVLFTITQLLSLDPGDEQGLVYESNPTVTDINNGYVTFTDITPDTLRGANLYTNATSGEGILQSNNPPPFAKDITSFKGYTFFGNTKTLQNLTLSLLSTVELIDGTSTLTITDGTVSNLYTFKTQTLTCDTHSSTLVDNITSTATLLPGASISGADFNPGTYIVSIIDANSITISQVATGTSAATSLVSGLESASSGYVGISQFATPGQQVDETARSLVRVINQDFDEIVSAFYISGPTDIPGKMIIEVRELSQAAFYFTVNSTTTGSQFTPNLPTSGNGVISENEVRPNRLYYSKLQQPEAVPILNFIDIGPQDQEIIRVIALRDNLYILKQEGIYRLSGLIAPFTVTPFDFSTNISASDSAVVLNNLIYMLSNQGVSTISDTGVGVVSRPIEDKLINLITPQFTNFETATFGVSYETDRAYYLFTVTRTSDVYATQCFRFNTFTNSWTILDLSKRSGIVNPLNDLLYLSATDVNYLEIERKLYDRTDFADREISLTLGTDQVFDNTIVLPSVTNISVGDVVVQTQKLTIKKFNQLLTKLDRDSLLSDADYESSLLALAGKVLSDKLDLLLTKISVDPGRTSVIGSTAAGSYTALIGTGNASFTALQTTFNSLITLLNTDVGIGYKTYITSTGSVDYEFVIDSMVVNDRSITTAYSYPLLPGPLLVYNHIETDIQFVPQFLTDVSMTKHVSDGTFIFEDASFTRGTVLYSSDLSANFESNIINGNGNGIFGNNLFGEGPFGGNGSGIPFRTYIPRDKQRCRYINARFTHQVAREIFSLYGLSLTFNMISTRGYR